MPGSTAELNLQTAVDSDDNADYLTVSLANSLRTVDGLFNNTSGHTHSGAHQGGPIGTIPPGSIAAGTITSAMIADGTIQSGDIAAGAITTTNILDGTIQTTDIGAGQVTSTNIGNQQVGTAQLADNSVTSAKIADGTITSADIGGQQITSALYAPNSIYAPSVIQASSIASGQLASGAAQALLGNYGPASPTWSTTTVGSWVATPITATVTTGANGVSWIRLEATASFNHTVAGALAYIAFGLDGAQTNVATINWAGANNAIPWTGILYSQPAAGSHTFAIYVYNNTAGTLAINAASYSSLWINEQRR